MVNEISNKTLVVLLVGAILISLAGTFVSINKINNINNNPTGMATSGEVKLSIQSTHEYNLTKSSVDFGDVTPIGGMSINVTTTASSSQATNDCSVNSGPCAGIEIENIGNSPINITFNSSTTAANLIGGSSPAFKYLVYNGDLTGNTATGANPGCNITLPTTWTEVTSASTWNAICSHLNSTAQSTGTKVHLEFNLTIPFNANQATNATLTFNAAAS